MLLFSDSHAETIELLALRMALEHGYDLDACSKPGCSALLTVPFREHCTPEQKYWRQQLAQTPYDLVMLATRWAWLTESNKYGDYFITPAFRRWGLLLPGDNADTKTLRIRMKKLLNESVEGVLRSGAQVMLVGQVPGPGKSVHGCMQLPVSKQELAEGKIPAACLGVSRRDAIQRNRFMDTLLTKMAYADKRITAITATKYFCGDLEAEYCRSVSEGRQLYSEFNHLSGAGSMFFSQGLKENNYEGIDFSYRDPNAARSEAEQRKIED